MRPAARDHALAAIPASANGGTGGFECNAVVGAVCIGSINGNSVEVDLGNVTVLQDFLNNDAVDVENNDVQGQVDEIASDTSVELKDVLNLQVCQVKVIELGKVNTNIANCN